MSIPFKREDIYSKTNVPMVRAVLKEEGGSLIDVPTLKQYFLTFVVDDPTEYTFAVNVFGDWHFCEVMRESRKMKSYVKQWRVEVDVHRKSKAFKTIIDEASDSSKRGSLSAAKYLLEEPWKAKDGRTKDGRKARQESRETTQAAAESRELKEDFERIQSRIN